jgi:tetratricopeptide (TPR) repeat protein
LIRSTDRSRQRHRTILAFATLLAGTHILLAQRPVPLEILAGRKALEAKDYQHAEEIFSAYVKDHPGNIDGEEGIGDAELGLHEYEAAELQYRAVVAAQPEFWLAHKNLVIVEAALGRWGEFDRERAFLRGARERGAPGISARESDVIDSLEVHGERWIVREYYEPAGRSLTRYNFEYFGPDGRVREYVSLESAEAARRALARSPDVLIGIDSSTLPAIKDFVLNYYTGKSHGTIKLYPKGEPSYEHVRADLIHWLQRPKPAM